MHYCYVFFFLQIQSQSLSLLKCLLFSLYVKLYNIIFGVSKMEKEKKNRTRINLFTCFSFDTCLSLSRMHRFFFPSKFSLACIIVQVLLKFATSIRLVLFLFLHQCVLLICFWYYFFFASTLLLFFPQIYIYYVV